MSLRLTILRHTSEKTFKLIDIFSIKWQIHINAKIPISAWNETGDKLTGRNAFPSSELVISDYLVSTFLF